MTMRNVAMAGAMLMMVGLVAKAETPPPAHGGVAAQSGVRTNPPTEVERQLKLFQLVSACIAERPGVPSAAEEILRRFRGGSN
jgi:hypothetical protein